MFDKTIRVISLNRNEFRNFGHLELSDGKKYSRIAESQSKEWIVAWNVIEESNNCIAIYNSQDEMVYFVTSSTIRPEKIHISNNGTILIEDSLSNNSLCSKITIINKNNKEFFNKKFNANIDNTEISPSGQKAIISFFRSDDKYSNTVNIIDIESGSIIFSKNKTGITNNCFFIDDKDILVTKVNDHTFILNENLDTKKEDLFHFYKSKLDKCDIESIEYTDRFLALSVNKNDDQDYVIKVLKKIIQNQFTEFNGISWVVCCLKKIAEIHIDKGKKEDAIQYLIDALYLDKNAGCKRTLNLLCKQLNVDINTLKHSEKMDNLLI